MKTTITVLFILLLFSCSLQTSLKPGYYKYVKPSRFESRYLFITQGIKSYVGGSEIILNNDSTFKHTSCGNIITGKWNIKKDSLFLKVLTNRWRNDSLNKYGFNGTWPTIPNKQIGFQIRNDCLLYIFSLENGEKVIEKLKFNEP